MDRSTLLQKHSVPDWVDVDYVDIGLTFPFYGGHFVDDGKIYVYVKRNLPRPAQATMQAVAQKLAERFPVPTNLPIEVLDADFNIIELSRWRGTTIRHLRNQMSEIVLLGTSKRTNRIIVGVEPGTDTARVRAKIEGAGVPSAAFQVEDTVICLEAGAEFSPECGGGGGSTSLQSPNLQQYASQLMGGYQFYNEENRYGNGATCTIGLVGQGAAIGSIGHPWVGDFMTTVSHCSKTMEGTDYVQYRQPGASDGVIGGEFQDGSPIPGGFWMCPYQDCRHSDHTIAQITGRSIRRGEIARTYVGTPEIDTSKPTFKVTVSYDNGRVNPPLIVNKVGMTTGWTFGSLHDNCFDVTIYTGSRDLLIDCGNLATYDSGSSDSGAAVWMFDPNFHGEEFVRPLGSHSGRVTFSDGTSYAFWTANGGFHEDLTYGRDPSPYDPWQWGINWLY